MKLTPEQIDALTAAVEKQGRTRAATQGFRFNEVDFICGAMTAFFALGNQGEIPAGWIFGPLGGRSALGIDRSPVEALDAANARIDHLQELLRAVDSRLTDLEEAGEIEEEDA